MSTKKLYIEESIASSLYHPSTTTIYNHGFSRMPSTISKFSLAPNSVGAYLFMNFAEFSSVSHRESLEKRNEKLNKILTKLREENRLPNCLNIRGATFIDCRIHLQDVSDLEIGISNALSKTELRELYFKFPQLQQHMFLNPGLYDSNINEFISKLIDGFNFPKHIRCFNSELVSTKISDISQQENSTIVPDINWSIGGFDLLTLSLKDVDLKSILELENSDERIFSCVFHINSLLLRNEVSYEKISKSDWGQNVIRNSALLQYVNTF